MGITSVDLDATDQLLIIYCALVKSLKERERERERETEREREREREYSEVVPQLFIDFKKACM